MIDSLRPLLTERQALVYELICDSIRTKQRPPSLRELMKSLGCKSPNGIVCHLNALETKGYVRREPGITRGIQVIGTDIHPPQYSIPIAGKVSAGQPLVAYELLEWLSLGDLLGEDVGLTAVQVEGNGMLDRMISSGDYLIRRDDRDILLWRPLRL